MLELQRHLPQWIDKLGAQVSPITAVDTYIEFPSHWALLTSPP